MTYALLDELYIFFDDTDPANTAQVPAALSFQILHHDATEHDKLGLDTIEDAMI